VECLPLGPLIIRWDFDGTKVWYYYWEHVEEPNENFGNFMIKHWEQFYLKNSPAPLNPTQKKNIYLEPFHWLHEILFLKLFVTIFHMG
jgi:hypothetical protein